MHIRLRRLGNRDDEQFVAIDDGEVCRCQDGVRKSAKHGHRCIAHQRLNLPAKGEDREAKSTPTIGTAANERMLLKRDHEAVDHGSADIEGRGEFSHREPVWGIREHFEHPKSAGQGLRRFSCHDSPP